MILVTGATGTIGADVLQMLARRGEHVRAMSRNPARIPPLPGVEIAECDVHDSAVLDKAMTDVDALMLLGAPGPWLVRHDRTMLAAACAAQVRRVVKLSAIDANTGNASDMELTELRPAGLASNTLRWAQSIRVREPVPNMTGSGTQGIVDPHDVAEAAVRILDAASPRGASFTLTGPELLSTPDLARELGRELRVQIETVAISADAYRRQMIDTGLHPTVIASAIHGSEFIASGAAALLTDDIEHLLGRPPRSYAAWVRDNRDAFFVD